MRHTSAFVLVNGTPVDHLSGFSPADWWAWIWTHIAPYAPPVIALLALAATVISWRLLRRGMRALIARAKRNSFEDNLTIISAAIATGVSATGMWKFADDVLHLWWPLRIILFAFIEVAIITSAVRAKRSMRENFKAGVDGIAVWALACLTAVLSSLDAASFGEAVFRLSAPLVAAWLWERGMRLERHRIRGTTGIHWRITPERIFVRLGLAEASDRTAGEVDAHRKLTRVALAIKKVKALQQAGSPDRKVRAALARLDKAMDAAVEYAGLAVDEKRQKALLAQIDTLHSTGVLVKREKVPAWADPVTEQQKAEAAAAVDELARLSARQATQRALDKAALTLMASVEPSDTPSTASKPDEVPDEKADGMPPRLAAVPPRDAVSSAAASGSPSAPEVTVERVDDTPNFDVADPSVYDLELMWSSTPMSAPTSTRDEADELPDDDDGKASKTEVMRAFWDSEIAQKRYPRPVDLATHAGASRSLAAELRAQWVEELSGWEKRRARKALRDKASA